MAVWAACGTQAADSFSSTHFRVVAARGFSRPRATAARAPTSELAAPPCPSELRPPRTEPRARRGAAAAGRPRQPLSSRGMQRYSNIFMKRNAHSRRTKCIGHPYTIHLTRTSPRHPLPPRQSLERARHTTSSRDMHTRPLAAPVGPRVGCPLGPLVTEYAPSYAPAATAWLPLRAAPGLCGTRL